MTFSLIPRDGNAIQRLIEARRARVEADPVHRTVKASKAAQRPAIRLRTGLQWWDTITGGGFVRGSVVLVHGEPGAGKSTALAQAAGRISGAVYVSAEESVAQVGARFTRLGLDCDLYESNQIDDILTTVGAAPFVVVDSIQMLGLMVDATTKIVEHARSSDSCFVIVCHETKDGVHAGPRTLEHLIDCSVKLMREPRWIHTQKNRFGPTGGLPLVMTERGLISPGPISPG